MSLCLVSLVQYLAIRVTVMKSGVFILAIMGRGKDLNNNERTTVHSLMNKLWNYDQNQLKYKERSLTLKEYEEYGLMLSAETLKSH